MDQSRVGFSLPTQFDGKAVVVFFQKIKIHGGCFIYVFIALALELILSLQIDLIYAKNYNFYLLSLTPTMKSPTLSIPYSSALSLSAVYSNKEPKTPTREQRKINGEKEGSSDFNYYKSEVNNKESRLKPDSTLRLTMRAPKNEKADSFLRSTMNTKFTVHSPREDLQGLKLYKNISMHQPSSDYKKTYQDKYAAEGQKESKYNESEKDSYNKLMQKMDKKDKLISELKKLHEVMVTEPSPSSYDTNRMAKKDGEGFKKYEEYSTNSNNLYVKDDYREMLSKSSHTTSDNYKNKTNSSFNNVKDRMVKKRGVSQIQEAVKNKNPEQDMFKKNSSTYYTSKLQKPVQKQMVDLKLDDKKWNLKSTLSKSPRNIDEYKTSSKNDHLYNSSYTSLKYTNDSYGTSSHSKTKDSSNYQYKGMRKPTLNDFQMKKSLGQGKFGIVYQAIHKQTKAMFALKKISKKIIKQNYLIDQFIQEIKIQNYCQHENILKLYGFFDDKQNIYLILEFMEEGTLFFQLKKSKTQTLSQLDTATKMKQLAEGIKYLHQQGIVHRDIKPENIVMTNGVSKLCDFGWAAICTERRKTYCGTFDYISPQILEGTQYNMSVDLWCLGILAYELLVGKAPFYHISRKQTMKKILNVESTVIDFPSHLSKNAISFIESLLKKNPEERMTGQDILRHPFLAQVKEKQM